MKGATASLRKVVALSEQNISLALYFENRLFRIEQLTMLFSAQKVLYILVSGKSLLHYHVKSSVQLQLNHSSPQ